MWVCETKACVTRRSSRADNAVTSPRSNSRARRPKRKSMNSAGSEKGSLTSRGCTSQVISCPSRSIGANVPQAERGIVRDKGAGEGTRYLTVENRGRKCRHGAAGLLCLQPPLAKFLQDAFTQKVGITLAGLGKFDDALGDDFVSEIAAVGKPKGYASHFERDAHDALGLKVEFGAVQEWGNRHGRPSLCRRERDWSLSHRRLLE